MKKLLKQTFKLTFILLMLFLSSCEKDLYDEMIKEKKRPDVKVSMKEVKNTPEIVSKLRKNFPSKLKTSSSARGADFLLTLQGDFGNVKLDNVLEVVKLNEKAFTFEIDETVKEPNVYLNLVIDAKDNIWLYKIDRIVQRYKDYPVNSERLVRFRLNNDLTHQPSTPCDTIIYPPFQPDPIDPTTGGGGIIFNGQWQGDYQPQGGFFPPVIISTPGGSTEGTSGSSSGSSGGGGDGETSVFQVIGEAIVDAWQWLVELFSGDPKPESSGCQCNRYSNVVILDVPSNPCDEGGTIAIIPQSPTLDKIYQLNDLLGNQLGYENKMYFYNTGLYLDYFLNLAQNPPADYAYFDILPDLINYLRTTGDFDFVEQTNNIILNNPILYPSAKPFIIEKQIYDEPLDPCFKGVLDELRNASNCDISKVLTKLGANNSVYKTVIKSENYTPVVPAFAQRYNPTGLANPLKYNYIIKVHTGYSSSTKLFKASILLHELIHAYFFSLSDDYYTGNDYTAFDDFPSLFQKFVLKSFPGSIGDAHHSDMALLYVDAVGRALQEFDTGIPVADNAQPAQVYTDLAWGGLGHAPIFNTFFPEGSTERQRVINRYACEGINQQQGNEIPIGGNPCN